MAQKRSREKPVILGGGRFLRLVRADGWEFVERVRATGVVAIVAVTADGELILTEQFRASVKGPVIDLPAGLAGDGPGTEELVTAARRELMEETGYDARRLSLLAHAPTSPGLTTEVVSFFRATGLKKVARGAASRVNKFKSMPSNWNESTPGCAGASAMACRSTARFTRDFISCNAVAEFPRHWLVLERYRSTS